MDKTSLVKEVNSLNQSLKLTDNALVGTGTRRYCYAFPEQNGLCIKIPKSSRNAKKQQSREVKFYKGLSRRNIKTDVITQYYGEVMTSMGTGYVYDMIRDEDGMPSLQLSDYIEQQPERFEEYIKLLDELEAYLFENRVVFYDLSPWNILCQKQNDGSLKAFIVDGIGDVVAIPILNLSKRLLKDKIKRRWLRMIKKMQSEHEWMSGYQFKND